MPEKRLERTRAAYAEHWPPVLTFTPMPPGGIVNVRLPPRFDGHVHSFKHVDLSARALVCDCGIRTRNGKEFVA